MERIKWFIGCSGFYYKEWKEVFYPTGLPQKNWFEYYCQHFNTLEINSSFYRFPKLANLKAWNKRAPDNFIFSIKVPGAITHYKQFRETQRMMQDFYNLVKEGLTDKQGPVLFQLPPKLEYSAERLDMMMEQIDSGFLNVMEFRNNTWWREDVLRTLSEKNIVFCGVSFPDINDDVMVNNAVCYYRFHGVPKLFYSAYDESFIQSVHEKINGNSVVTTAFVYFNNTASTAALNNGKFLQQLAGGNV